MIKWLLPTLLIIGCLMAVISVFAGLRNSYHGSQDFQWQPANELLKGNNPYELFLQYNEEGVDGFLKSQNPNYPSSGLFFLFPYAAMDWQMAELQWAFSNMIWTFGILLMLYNLMGGSKNREIFIVLATLFLLSTPWRVTVGNGQHGLFSLFFFLLGTLYPDFPRTIRILSIAASWLKYTLTFPLTLYYLKAKKHWWVIIGAASVHAILTLALAQWTDSDLIQFFTGPLKVAEVSTHSGQSGVADFFAIAGQLGLDGKLLPGLLSVLTILFVIWLTKDDHDTLSCLSTFSFVSMIVVFHLIYDFVIFVIPMAYALKTGLNSIRSLYYFVAVMWVWVVQKFIEVTFLRLDILSPISINDNYLWINFILCATVLIADCINAKNNRCLERPLFSWSDWSLKYRFAS